MQPQSAIIPKRDLTGFIDATENPKDAKTRREMALLDISDNAQMLARMYGKTDKLHDHLMDHTTPTMGAMFFTPSIELLGSLKI